MRRDTASRLPDYTRRVHCRDSLRPHTPQTNSLLISVANEASHGDPERNGFAGEGRGVVPIYVMLGA
jgi:hypothetical protein